MNQQASPTIGMTPASITISRTFAAPRTLVFDAWTKPEHLARWFAPKDFTVEVRSLDLRPGGAFHFCMRSPKGEEVWGLATYREILPPERIVYTDTFSDPDGNVVPPAQYGAPGYPLETLVTVTFADADDGGTAVTVEHAIPESYGDRNDPANGWSQILDNLARHLAADDRATDDHATDDR